MFADLMLSEQCVKSDMNLIENNFSGTNSKIVFSLWNKQSEFKYSFSKKN